MNCNFCESTDHYCMDCTSNNPEHIRRKEVSRKLKDFDDEIHAIMKHDILTHEAYRLTPSVAAFIEEYRTHQYSTCRLQRIMIVLRNKPINELQELVKIYVESDIGDVSINDLSTYELVACLVVDLMRQRFMLDFDDFGISDDFTTVEDMGYYTIEDDMGPVTQVFLNYVTRAWLDKMPQKENDARLFNEVMDNSIVHHRLEQERLKQLQNLKHAWNDKTMEQRRVFLHNSKMVMLNPGENNENFHRFFGNVKMDEIAFTFPGLQDFLPSHYYNSSYIRSRQLAVSALHGNILFNTTDPYKSTEECQICYETTCNAYTNCQHEFCIGCIRSHINTCRTNWRRPTCPICRERVTQVNSNEEAPRPEVVDLTA